MASARATASASTVLLPIPAGPSTSSAKLRPRRAASRRSVIRASSRARPWTMRPGSLGGRLGHQTRQLGARAHARLAVDRAEAALDRLRAEEQRLADLAVR